MNIKKFYIVVEIRFWSFKNRTVKRTVSLVITFDHLNAIIYSIALIGWWTLGSQHPWHLGLEIFDAYPDSSDEEWYSHKSLKVLYFTSSRLETYYFVKCFGNFPIFVWMKIKSVSFNISCDILN